MGILKVNSTGTNVEFMNIFHEPVSDAYNIKELQNGFALFGRRASYPYLVKTDVNGRTDTTISITSSAHNYCDGDTCILSTQQSTSYLWSTGDTTQSISVIQNGMYIVKTTDSIGNQFLSQCFQVTFHSPSTIHLGSDTTLCINQSITLNAGNGFTNYLWQDSSTAPTLVATSATVNTLSYFVQVTDSNLCTSSDTLQIVFDVCTGVNSLDENKFFNISPNPFTNKLSFYPLNPSPEKIIVEVLNSIGTIVYQIETTMRDHELNLSGLQSGIYFLKIKSTINYLTRKIVKL